MVNLCRLCTRRLLLRRYLSRKAFRIYFLRIEIIGIHFVAHQGGYSW